MSAIIEELKKIEWARNLIALILFVVVLISFYALLVRPALSDFGSGNVAYRKAIHLLGQTGQSVRAQEERLMQFGREHQSVLLAFAAPFDVEGFSQRCREFFRSFKMEERSMESGVMEASSPFESRQFQVEAELSSPTDLYRFLEFLNGSGTIARVDFPLRFEQEREVLRVFFLLTLYRHTSEAAKLLER